MIAALNIDKIDFKNHIAIKGATTVFDICSEFFSKFDVSYFNYKLAFRDGSRIKLSSSARWEKHFFERAYFEKFKGEHHPDSYRSGFGIWSDWEPYTNERQDAIQNFGMATGITFIKQYNTHSEIVDFSSDNPYKNHYNYLNQVEIFQKFIAYFKEQGGGLIEEAKQHVFKTSLSNTIISHDEPNFIYSDNSLNALSTEFLQIKRFKDENLVDMIPLSYQEAISCWLLAKGYSSKAISVNLGISSRTVDNYLRSAMYKIGCQRRVDLVLKIHESNLFRLFEISFGVSR